MARKPPTQQTIKRLFAVSGNLCAFDPCGKALVDGNGDLQCQICHIEAANPGGERYNSNQSDEQRRGFDNLLLLCHAHHTTTNNVIQFPVEAMKKMKADHESKFAGGAYKAPEKAVKKLAQQAVTMGDGDGTRILVTGDKATIVVNPSVAVPEEQAELTVIDEIFKDVLTKIKARPSERAPGGPSLELNEKITLNFASSSEQETVAEFVRAALLKMTLIEGAFRALDVETQSDVTGHVFYRYSQHKIDGLKPIDILLKLFAEFTPKGKESDPQYTNLARAFVLFFFDDCTIFEKTPQERATATA